MDRRGFLRRGALALPVGALAAPAVAQGGAGTDWRLISTFAPGSILHAGAVEVSDRVRAMTGGRFVIEVLPPEDGADAAAAIDAVRTGKAEACHTVAAAAQEREPTYALATSVPFGLNARLTQGWLRHGGGSELLDAFFLGEGLKALACGNTGAQMGGWFRTEMTAPEDFEGLRMRIGGLGARVAEALGAEAVQVEASGLAAALEDGTLDAAEWIGPAEDEALGLGEAAPIYHYPGWWEGGATLHLMAGQGAWDSLPDESRAALDAACRAAGQGMLARLDAANPSAIKRLVAGGAQLRPFPPEVLQAAFDAAQELLEDISGQSKSFAAILASQNAFKRDAYLWMQLSELNFDSFLMAQDNAGRL